MSVTRIMPFLLLLLPVLVKAQQPKLVLPVGHTGHVKSVAFSPDGKKILSTDYDRHTKVWSCPEGKLLLDLDSTEEAGYSPDGKMIVSFLHKKISCRNSLSGELVRSWEANSYFDLKYMEISPGGRTLLSLSHYTDTATVWNMSDGSVRHILVHRKTPDAAHFSKDGTQLITRVYDSLFTWDAASGELLSASQTERPSSGAKVQRVISPDGNYFLDLSLSKMIGIRRTADEQLVAELKGHTHTTGYCAISPDGQYIASVNGDQSLRIWNSADGKLLSRLSGHRHLVRTAEFDSSGKKVLSASYDFTAREWEVPSGKLLRVMDGALRSDPEDKSRRRGVEWLSSASYDPSGAWFMTAGFDHYLKIWYAADGKLEKEIETGGPIDFACFSPDGRYILVLARHSEVSLNRSLYVFRTGDWKLVNEWGLGMTNTNQFQLSPDMVYLVTIGSLKITPEIWKIEDGKLSPAGVLEGHTADVRSVRYSADGRTILTASADGTARTWDAATGMPLQKFTGHQQPVNLALFSPDGKTILTCADDNTLKKWDAGSGKLLYTFFPVDSLDYFMQTEAGYYQTTPAAAKLLHYVTRDQEVITFEQLDVKYNRPDKVLEAMGSTDSALIRSYRKAWEKRIRKLGIDTSQFREGYSVPECDFLNRDAIQYEQRTGTISLHIRGSDSSYLLDRFNIWVNESPLYGQRGISIRKRKSHSLDTTIVITLSQGGNRIEASITNVNGTESYRMPLQVNYTPAEKQKEILRFIGIGIDRFADSKNNLQYSSKDIRDLAVKLKEKYKDDIIIDTLFNEEVTTEKVKALKKKLQQSSVNDKIIISYSGHGLLSKEYDYYLSTYSINFDKPEKNGLPYDELENLLDSIPARKKLMLIDACHSGEVDKEEMVRITAAEDSLNKQGTKGGKPTYTGKTSLGMKNSFELMQSLFVNVGKSTGATIISAAAGTQFALERGDLKNGVFTYCILEAMEKNPTMKISELKRIVGERVERLTNGLQKPTSRNETIAVDWSL